MIDLTDKARRMLENDLIVWFTTVAENGVPHAVPVWFFWHEGRAFLFSEPASVKVRHVRAGSPVLLHLNAGGPGGDDVVVLTGTAEASDGAAAATLEGFREAYLTKYAEAIEAFGMPAEAISQKFSTSLVFTPEKLLAW